MVKWSAGIGRRIVRDKGDHEGEDEGDGEHGGKEEAGRAEHSENTEGGEELLEFGGVIMGASRVSCAQFNLMRSLESHWAMSDRMTLSPGTRPLMTSMVLTELRPSFTCVRVA